MPDGDELDRLICSGAPRPKGSARIDSSHASAVVRAGVIQRRHAASVHAEASVSVAKDTEKSLFENLPSEKKRTVNLFLPSLLWANSQRRRLLASGACPMISCEARCRTGERGS